MLPSNALRRLRGRSDHMLLRVAGVLALLCCTPAARAEPVAITFDDLPVANAAASSPDAIAITRRLLAGLHRSHIPAIGFVNEGKLAGAERAAGETILKAWLDAGMDLGNHGYSHLSFTATPLAAYIADAAAGDPITRPLMAAHGKREQWWRFPYLETGSTPQAKAGFEAWLAEHGYRIAPVTMENSDYQFAAVYDAALARRDAAGAQRVRQAYLDHSAKIVAWYETAALGLLGRRPAFVFLLHASRLNADMIGPLSALLKSEGLRFVTLRRAVRDPAYRIADTYVGPDGDQWLTRWSLTLHRPLPWSSLPTPPSWITQPG